MTEAAEVAKGRLLALCESVVGELRASGYWSADIALGEDGGHEITLLTHEGWKAMKGLAVRAVLQEKG